MTRIRPIIPYLLIFIAFILPGIAAAQYKIRGTVYDSARVSPVELVSVLSTSGKGTVTNAAGYYEIEVGEKDSIWFSYLNKPTIKFSVLKIATPLNFDIALAVNMPVLKEIKIRPRNYREDSIANREAYAKVFNFERPGLKAVTPSYGAAAGFDINEIINVFRFRRNRNMRSFQERLVGQEQDKFVDHRFSKGLVRRLTGASDSTLQQFMTEHRPSYWLTVALGEYDFQKYIKDSYDRFLKGLPPLEMMLTEEEE